MNDCVLNTADDMQEQLLKERALFTEDIETVGMVNADTTELLELYKRLDGRLTQLKQLVLDGGDDTPFGETFITLIEVKAFGRDILEKLKNERAKLYKSGTINLRYSAVFEKRQEGLEGVFEDFDEVFDKYQIYNMLRVKNEKGDRL